LPGAWLLNRAYGDKNFHYIGDAWTFMGIDRGTKLVLAFELGKRNTESARKFMRKIALATSNEHRFQMTTDGFAPYNYAVGMELDGRVDYAQLVKTYASPTPEEQRRYSPARVVSQKSTDVFGDPDFDLICTSHIERQNGSLRQSMAVSYRSTKTRIAVDSECRKEPAFHTTSRGKTRLRCMGTSLTRDLHV
jgi:IS1 family transposase